MMKKILIRAGMLSTETFSAIDMLRTNIIGGNVGNLLYQNSIMRALTVENTEFVANRYKYIMRDIEKINNEYSSFIIPLADAFRPTFRNELTKITNFVKSLKIPCIVIGVGLRAPFEPNLHEGFEFDEDVINFVKAVLEKSSMIGVRGQITADYLTRLGFKEGTDHTVIGCPSMYTFGKHLSIRKSNITLNSKIAYNTSPSTSMYTNDFILKEAKKYKNSYFIPQERNELQLIYIGEDYKNTAEGFYPAKLEDPQYANGQARFFLNAQTWFDFFKDTDLTFGSRLHGNIASILGGCQSLLITKDARTRELAQYHNLPHVAYTEISEKTTIEELISKVDFESPLKNQEQNFNHYIDFLNKNNIEHIYKENVDRKEAPLDTQINSIILSKPVIPINVCLYTEEFQRLSTYKLEKELKKIKNKLELSQKTLDNTQNALVNTQNALVNTQNALVNTQNSLSFRIGRTITFIPRKIRNNLKRLRKHTTKKNSALKKFITYKIFYPLLYKIYATKKINEKKVVFIEFSYPKITNSFQLLYNKICNEYNFNVSCHFLNFYKSPYKIKVKQCIKMIKDIATAKYIFINEACPPLSCLPLRKVTIVTQTWHGCGAFKKFGLSTGELKFGVSLKEHLKYPAHKNNTHITISSPEVTWAYAEAMNLDKNDTTIKATGVSRTDIYYDNKFKHSAYNKLQELFPESKNKKVLLYAPTFRGSIGRAKTSDKLNIDAFFNKLEQDYVLIIKHHPAVKNKPLIQEQYFNFARDLTNDMTIEELLCVSDICISDYSSLVFEYSLLEKPMIFFTYDIEDYIDWRGFYYPMDEFCPGPMFNTNEEIIEYIMDIENQFDPQLVKDFRYKFMRSCDGNATNRILKLVFEDNLEKYKKK